MITLEAAEMVPAALTVFSDDTGAYAMPAPKRTAPAGTATLAFRKLGYETQRQSGSPAAGASVDITLKPTDNVAREAPASAWLQDLPDTVERYRTVLLCSGCHQCALESQLATAGSIQKMATVEEREKAWRDVFTRMRALFLTIQPDDSAFSADKLPPEVAQQVPYTLLTREDEEVIAPFLAKHFPLEYEHMPLSMVPRAPLGAGKGTVVREYQLPLGSHVREVAVANGSPYLWGADMKKNVMLRLDFTDGSQKWFPFPAQEATGPHTIAGDAEGNIWLATQEADRVGKFDPREERWTRVYRFSPMSSVHDIALNSRNQVAFDRSGNLWLTLMNKNSLSRVNAETGETAEFELPVPEGADTSLGKYNIALYGAAMASDRRTIWFTQLNGHLGAFDTETSKVVTKISFPRGTGPRRLGIDDDDVLYVPLTGAGRLLVYDARQKKELGTYDLPDRNSAPYVAVWDPRRKVVWLGTSSANLIYQFDPSTKQFVEFPLPRVGAYMRRLELAPNGDVWTSYANHPAEKGPSMAVVVTPGDSVPQGSVAQLAE